MAITRYGLTGPMTAYGTFSAKEEAEGGGGGGGNKRTMMMMGIGSIVWWFLLNAGSRATLCSVEN